MKMWIVLGITMTGLALIAGIIKISGNRTAETASSGNSATAESPASVSPAPSEIKSSAKVLKTTGEVNLTRDSQQSKINVDDILYEKDIIQTSAKSSAIIVFLANDSTVRLDGNSKIEISLYQGNGQDAKISLDQPFGKTWHRIKQLLGQNSSYEVNTPTVVASVRGTGFGVNADNKDATITVDDGKVNTKLVDRSGPEIKVLHEINVVKDEEAKIDNKEFQKIKGQVERGETPDFKPKLIEKEKVEEWIKNSREEEKEMEMRKKEEKVESREGLPALPTAKPLQAGKVEGEKEKEMGKREEKETEIKEEIKEPDDKKIEEVKGEKTESGERKVETEDKKTESGKENGKEEEKKEEKQPEAIIERIKDFIEGKPEKNKSKPYLDTAR